MDKKEKHVRENEGLEVRGKKQKNSGMARSNRLWLWLGVLVLIFILIYWLFAIGTFEDWMGVFNG